VVTAGQQVTVVRVDLSESMFGRRGGVKGVTGAEGGETRKSVHSIAHAAKQGRGHGQPTPHAGLLIRYEVLDHRPCLARGQVAFAQMPAKGADELQTPELR
jgi:hypothetical protein